MSSLAEGSAGEEVAEGILLVAKREFESRKLPLYAELVASLAFAEVDPATANLCVRLIERLSFRQLCLLTAFSRGPIRDRLRKHGFKSQSGNPAVAWVITIEANGILVEALELEQLGLMRRSDNAGVMHYSDLEPSSMRLEGIGEELVRLALGPLSDDEILRLMEPLMPSAWDKKYEA